MSGTKPVGPAFREGDEIVLSYGPHQGTPGAFLRLTEDANRAEIIERNGSIRSHPVEWLAHSTAADSGSAGSGRTAPSAFDKTRWNSNGQFRNCEIEVWEGEGGAAPGLPGIAAASMTGTVSQVEWAQRIRRQVNDDFNRVAASFRVIADRQTNERRADTEAILDILEDKRTEVMSNERAGYFIHDWQEINDQVRQLIFHDPRYKAIKNNRPARRR